MNRNKIKAMKNVVLPTILLLSLFIVFIVSFTVLGLLVHPVFIAIALIIPISSVMYVVYLNELERLKAIEFELKVIELKKKELKTHGENYHVKKIEKSTSGSIGDYQQSVINAIRDGHSGLVSANDECWAQRIIELEKDDVV